ncbi:Protein MON2 homolog [Acanthosepion pharaonis]|uniref:Protein MON2 homolog n=1 Tax=Acanthosepion pharaonis TaxID=158019 RepID=A0A812D7N7_ACAPH|nr:Protein MON2 homolog [Sepia pharaonis]
MSISFPFRLEFLDSNVFTWFSFTDPRRICSYLSIYLSRSVHIYLSIYLGLFIFIYLSISVCSYLSISLSRSVHIYRSIYLGLFIFIYLSRSVHIYLSISVCSYLSKSVHIYLSIYLICSYLSMFISIYLNLFIFTYLSIYLGLFIFIYVHIYLSKSVHIYLSISLSLFISIHLSQSVHIYLSSSDCSYLSTFRLPLGLKYGCPSPTTWMLSINALLNILGIGLPVARKHEAAFQGMWPELALALEEFLFSKHPSPPTLSIEDFQRDETVDCKVVQVIRDDILPYAGTMPKDFIMKIMDILNKGSIHSATSDTFIDTESSRKLREEFAKGCFETLLQFSFITRSANEGSLTKMAVQSLLQRCQEVVKNYVEDERLSGKCPLPRPRLAEIASVLKAITTLLLSLKKASPINVEPTVWHQVIHLYPSLVECTTSSSPQVCKALKEALHEYKDLLAPPMPQNNQS